MSTAWIPDPRECLNCRGLGIVGDFTDGGVQECEDCEGTGTEYRNPEAVERRRNQGEA